MFICFRRRISLALSLAILLAFVTYSLALAHARLLRSNPEDGAILTESPREVRLWFDEPIAVEFSSVEVFDANARRAGVGTLRSDASDPALVIASLPELPEGVHSLNWKVFSNADSHFTRGTLVFGVGQAAGDAALTASSPQTDFSLPPTEVFLRLLNYFTLAALVGSALTAGVVLRTTALAPARGRVWGLAIVAALLALAVGFGWLAWQANALGRGLFDDVLTTRFGRLWLARQCCLLLVIITAFPARRDRAWAWIIMALTMIALAILQALNSHAAGLPERTALAVVVSAAHLLAAGAWVGSLFALLVGLFPLLGTHRELALEGWRRFGWVAVTSVGLIAATGLYNVGRQVASVDAWLATFYGQTLTGKTMLFVIVGLLGLINSSLLHPRLSAAIAAILRRPAGWMFIQSGWFPLILLAEAGAAVLIFLASGLLTAAPPARGPEFDSPSQIQKPPSSLSLAADDILVTLAIRPNKPGLNILTVDAVNTRRPPPAEIIRVLVRLTYREQDLGTQTLTLEPETASRYRLSTNALSLAGGWQVQAVVRRSGMEDSVANFEWQVEALAPATPPRPVIISNAPIESPLTLIAIGVVSLTVLIGAVAASQQRQAADLTSRREQGKA